MSLGPIPSGRLKNPRDVDKWSSLRHCLSLCGMSVTRELGLYLCCLDGSYNTLSPVVIEVLHWVHTCNSK